MKSIITPTSHREEFITPLGVDAGPNLNPPGLICAANEARFTASHYQEPLVALTVGWTDRENLTAQRERLFPEVSVPRRFEFKKADNAKAFLTESDDLRPIGSPFKRIEYSGTSAQSKTNNHGLTVRIDHDECDDVESEVRAAIDRMLARTTRNSFRRGITLLEANDTNEAQVWGAADNPDGDVRANLIASANITGVFPNLVAYGELAWHYRLNSYEAPARVNGQNRSGLMPQQLAQYFGADAVEIIKARYQSSATAKSVFVAAVVYAYLAQQGASKDDPSAVKRFVSSGRGGQKYGVYRQDHEKFTDVSLEYYELMLLTGLGIVSQTITES